MNQNNDFLYLHYPLPPDIQRYITSGDHVSAQRLIDRTLRAATQPELTARLRVERERLNRLPEEYPHTIPETKAQFREEWPTMTDADFQALLDAGRIDWRNLNGEPHCSARALESCRLYPAEAPGLTPPPPDPAWRTDMLRRMRTESGLSSRITIRATIRPTRPSTGEHIQAWLPIPSPRFQQSEVELLEYTPGGVPGPPDAPQRTIYWEDTRRDTFSVTYRYRVRAPWVDPDTLICDPVQPSFCLDEQPPHILFTPFLRDLAARVTRGCATPLQRARAIYDYVTGSVDYRYQPAYFQLPPIASMCASQLRGDCGVMAVLFITLCRLSGVPARWQSGLWVEPGHAGNHDWAMFYIAPHGWLWADPSFGSAARRQGDSLRRAHYFGNLDPCRMAANHAFAAPLSPPDPAWRADPTDNQRGEMTVDGAGLRAGEMERDAEVLDFEFLPFK